MDPYIGEIRMFGGNFAPRGWAFCNGQLLSVSQYTALFSILGVTYGGNGQSNFALPNLQGRVPMHWGNGSGLSPHSLGETAGTETVTLLASQMPTHNHLLSANSGSGDQTSPTSNVIAETVDLVTAGALGAFATSANTTLNPSSITPAGSNQPHPNLQPYLCVSFIIAVEGIFPPRP